MADTRDMWDEAIQEAYVSNPSDDVIVHTIEFRNVDIVDENGVAAAMRFVQGQDEFEGGLERTAELNPGEMVLFLPAAFGFELPATREGELPKFKLSIDNVGKILMDPLQQATTSFAPIYVTYRPYLLSNPSKPQMDPPLTLRLHAVKADNMKVEGVATFDDVMNKIFPAANYTRDRFPLLYTQE